MPIRSSKYRAGLLTLKYMPILMALIMYIHVILMRIGIYTQIATTIAGSAILPSILIFTMSSMLKFCYIHKTLTIYSLVVDLFTNLHFYFNLGLYGVYLLDILFFIGTGVFILLLNKLNMYNTKCCVLRADLIAAIKRWQKKPIEGNVQMLDIKNNIIQI